MKKIIIATHSGSFHADDLFAVATLSLLLGKENIEVIRTRDEKVIENADYVVDVGGVYDPAQKRFDHHQVPGPGERDNRVPYAAFGLVWKEYGAKVAGSKEAQHAIDTKLVQPIDAADNGLDVFEMSSLGVFPYLIQSMFASFTPLWDEEKTHDDVFDELVILARTILSREIVIAEKHLEAGRKVKEVYERADDKEVVVFSKEHPYGRRVISSVLVGYTEPVYAVLYRPDNSWWQVIAINKDAKTYGMRKPLPENWRGKMDEDLQKESGIRDALFCHRSGFMAIIETREGAIALAKKALEM